MLIKETEMSYYINFNMKARELKMMNHEDLHGDMPRNQISSILFVYPIKGIKERLLRIIINLDLMKYL